MKKKKERGEKKNEGKETTQRMVTKGNSLLFASSHESFLKYNKLPVFWIPIFSFFEQNRYSIFRRKKEKIEREKNIEKKRERKKKKEWRKRRKVTPSLRHR